MFRVGCRLNYEIVLKLFFRPTVSIYVQYLVLDVFGVDGLFRMD